MGSPPILLDHLLEPPGHDGHQAPQVVAVVHGVHWVGLGKGQNPLQCGLGHAQLVPDGLLWNFGLPKLNCCSLVSMAERFLAVKCSRHGMVEIEV